jgi:hypothetical protein
MQRWTWDLHYPPLDGPRSYGMQAIYHDTPTSPLGSSALPGAYTVKLTADGKSFTQPLMLKMDPRVTTSAEAIARMFEVSHNSYQAVKQSRAATAEIRNLIAQLQALQPRATQPLATVLTDLQAKATALEGAAAGGGRRGGAGRGAAVPAGNPTVASVGAQLTSTMTAAEDADAAPVGHVEETYDSAYRAFTDLFTRWNQIKAKDLPSLNEQLKQAQLPALTVPAAQ